MDTLDGARTVRTACAAAELSALRAAGAVCACAVVLAEAPTSAKPGAEALVLPDGTIEGFVGGTCAESTVRAQGLALLDSGESLLLRITPTPEPDQTGKLVVHNPCLSGGTLEIFLEPVMPAPAIVVAGTAPVADALRALAVQLGWRVADDGDLTAASALRGRLARPRRGDHAAGRHRRRRRRTSGSSPAASGPRR